MNASMNVSCVYSECECLIHCVISFYKDDNMGRPQWPVKLEAIFISVYAWYGCSDWEVEIH